jgi:hypothetical protein
MGSTKADVLLDEKEWLDQATKPISFVLPKFSKSFVLKTAIVAAYPYYCS